MRTTLIKISASIFCFAMMTPALADFGHGGGSSAAPSTADSNGPVGAPPSNSPPPGYAGNNAPPPAAYGSGSNNSPPPSPAPAYGSGSNGAPPSTTGNVYGSNSSYAAPPPPPVKEKHKKHDRFSFNVTLPGSDTVISLGGGKHIKTHRNNQPPFWLGMNSGEPMPANAVVGGSQYNPDSRFYVCRAQFRGGVHPGKLYASTCNISWGGNEIALRHYEVLVAMSPMSWVASNHGGVPHHAFEGGHENHHKLYVCQADYANGTHTGKVVGHGCNFAWSGREVSMPYYNVLVG